MNKTVYLAGPITGLSFGEADDWRDEVVRRLADVGVTCFNPLRGKYYRGKATSDGSHHGSLQGHHRVGVGQVVNRRDTWDVRRSDIVLVNVLGADKVSIGTVLEVGYAYGNGKYIVLVMEEQGNPHDHGMLLDMASAVVNQLSDAVDVIPTLLGVNGCQK